MSSANITVIGGFVVDHFMVTYRLPDPRETLPANDYKKARGGKGANAALAIYRSCHKRKKDGVASTGGPERDEIDIKVRMMGAVGQDADGTDFIEFMTTERIDMSGVLKVDMITGLSFVTIEQDPRDNRILYFNSANGAMSPEHFNTVEALGNGVRPDLIVAQLEIKIEAVEQMLDTAGKAGIDVLLNLAPATNTLSDKYCFITHLVVNVSEAAILSGRRLGEVKKETWEEIAKEFLSDGVKNVVITLGAEGAFFANEQASDHVEAFKIELQDPTGAEDTFTGVYAAEYVRRKKKGVWDIKEAVIRACKASALTVATLGAQDGIPWADEIDSFDIAATDQTTR